MSTRRAQFAGSWYPATASECEEWIARFCGDANLPEIDAPLHGGIVPHAGWVFSGQTACRVVQWLADSVDADVVLVLGNHMSASSPEWIIAEGEWDTPFGPIPVSHSVAADLSALLGLQPVDAAAALSDNTIELQLPFIRHFFPRATIVPIALAPKSGVVAAGTAIGEYMAKRQGHGLVIGSTDLTHYGLNYGFTPQGNGPDAGAWVRNTNDRGFIRELIAMNPDAALAHARRNHSACCPGAAAAALAAAIAMGAQKAWEVEYAMSSDVQPGDSFVGYVGLVF